MVAKYFTENFLMSKFQIVGETIKEKVTEGIKKVFHLITPNSVNKLISSSDTISTTWNNIENESTYEDFLLDSNSCAAIVSHTENDQWETYFKKYYIDASENYYGNFENYLITCLKLMNHFPEINWEKEIKTKSVELPKNTSGKKTLILDLDETLIHADLDFLYTNHDVVLTIFFEDESSLLIPIIIRPYLKEFLEFAYEKFELICFTAGCKYYADAILDYLEKDKKYFTTRLYRDSCLFLDPGIFIKDLKILQNRNLKDVVIVDNSLLSFANQLSNGILISSFCDDRNDNVLRYLQTYLEDFIYIAEDVRKVNLEFFQFEKYKEEMKDDL
jgi:Dullard-like phosphatase family protein